MMILPQLSFLPYAVIFIAKCCAHAIASELAKDIFLIPQIGKKYPQGNCASPNINKQDIDSIVDTTARMLENAEERVMNLLGIPEGEPTTDMLEVTTAKTAVVLAGVDPSILGDDGTVVLSEDARGTLETLRGNLYGAKYILENKREEWEKPRYLTCDDTAWKWQATKDEVMAGSYNSKLWGIDFPVSHDYVSSHEGWDPAKGLCAINGLLGGVRHEEQVMILCPALFTKPDSDLLRDRQYRLDEGDPLNDVLTMQGAFLHEMMHLSDGNRCALAVLDRTVDGKPAYGYDLCSQLPDAEKLGNADNYQLIATALWLDEFDWSTGKAVPLPTDDDGNGDRDGSDQSSLTGEL
ncbi:hypothetical protein PG993_000381 [Apiospora rasikravindrae]|uniref:Lysine-specific metallo-endopeptidase domain-containing protein n=1 Tax=Apiospora rasikravindrae TaxID=990691 RepID=A0ABR1U8E1_9PEZI